MFQVVAGLYALDPDLLEAIASVESNGDSAAVSPAGAEGLMQLMPDTARRFRVTNPFDPVDSALGAARFLDHLRRRQRGGPSVSDPDLVKFLAAYNAGEGAVDKYGGVPPYPETEEYVRRVVRAYLLNRWSGEGPGPTLSDTPADEPVAFAPRPRVADPDLQLLGRLRRLRTTARRGAPTAARNSLGRDAK